MRRIPLDRARRIVLGAQGLTASRPTGKVDIRHLRKMFRTIGVLQIDSVNVLERAHHLTAFSRLGDHEKDLPWDALGRRELFEYWGHEAAFLPVETWPLWRHKMDQPIQWRRARELNEREPGYIDSIEEDVARRGPLTTSDLEDFIARPDILFSSAPPSKSAAANPRARASLRAPPIASASMKETSTSSSSSPTISLP